MKVARDATILLTVLLGCGFADNSNLPDSVTPFYANAAGFDLMSNASCVINKDDYIPFATNRHYFFNNGGTSNFTLNDTNHMRGLQTDASKVTLKKIVSESVGAATGGAFGAYACSKIAGDHVFWQGAAVFIGVAAGAAGGATSVGNLLMEPNGSFTRSLIGSTAGTGLSAGVLVFILLASWDTGSVGWTEYYVAPCLAAVLPVAGAVIGYNLSISRKSVTPMMNSPQENGFLDGGSQRHYPSIKLQLITMRF